MVEDIPSDKVIAVSVRNPLTRVPSMWSYLKRRNKTHLDFDQWLVESYGKRRRGWSGWSPLYTTMVEHLRPILARIEFVIRVESLWVDVKNLWRWLGIEWMEPSTSKLSCTPDSLKFELTAKQRQIIQTKSSDDFEIFGYSTVC